MIPQNNASSTLAAAIVSTGATTFTVATGEGVKFGAGPIPVWVSAAEAMLMTSRSGDVLTVTRAQQGTTAVTHLSGATVSADVDKALLEGLRDEAVVTSNSYTDAAIAGLGGVTGGNWLSTLSADVPITGTTTVTSGGYGKMHRCSGTSANYPVTLPSAVTAGAGVLMGFLMDPGLTKLVTLTSGTGTQLDGAATRVMWANETCILKSDGAQWRKIAGRSLPMVAGMVSGSYQSVASSTQVAINTDTADSGSTNVTAMNDTGNSAVKILRPGRYDIDTFAGFPIGVGLSMRLLSYIGIDPANGTYVTFAQREVWAQAGAFVTGQSHLKGRLLVLNSLVKPWALHTSAAGSETMYGGVYVTQVIDW